MGRRGKVSGGPDGIVVVDKPAGMTSHDVVGQLRRLARTRRVGHAGTLDPMATGVLVIAVNRATRLLPYLDLDDKGYTATIRLGQSTHTDDAEGEPTGGASAADVDEAAVLAAMAPLTGDIVQVPSSVSAIKVDGQRSYDRVRAGEDVVLEGRAVTVKRFEALAFRRPANEVLDVDVAVDCTSGTYVRALARDLGTSLGVGGHLTALRRTRVGGFTLEHASSLETLAELENPVGLSLSDAIAAAFPVREISFEEADEISYGRSLTLGGLDGLYGVLTPDRSPVALLQDASGRGRPVLVFIARG